MSDIRTLRLEKGLTQQELAMRSGSSLAYVAMLDRGYRPANGGEKWDAVLQALGEAPAPSPASPPPRRLRAMRRQRQMSVSTLAKLSGVSEGAIGNAEHGRVVPTQKTLKALASALACGVEEIA